MRPCADPTCRMFQYLVRRGAIGLVTLLLITFVVYALIRNIPGTPLTVDMAMMNPGKMASADDIKRFERLYGLDKPWYEAYFIWLGNVVRGDFGRSIPQEQSAGARADHEPAAGDAACSR